MKLNDLYKLAKEKGRLDICRFMRNMKRADLKLSWYEGRFFWKGPSVTVSHVTDAMRLTRVRCQFDNMGLDYVVYPVQGL